MTDWNADLYRRFERERTRPARDLLAQAARVEARTIIDLGCGPGNSTELLADRFPQAEVIGVDTSPAMLSTARARLPGVVFVEADISTFTMSRPIDLLFANAVLQWVPDHAALLPRLIAMLAPGGVLAVQMPDNSEEPSHRLMRQIAAEPPFRSSFEGGGAVRPRPVLAADAYYDLLAPLADTDVWHTTYRHPIDSAAGIVAWVRATGLRPFLDALPPSQTDAFLARYEAEIETAYPPRADGLRLLAFPRLFIVARRRA